MPAIRRRFGQTPFFTRAVVRSLGRRAAVIAAAVGLAILCGGGGGGGAGAKPATEAAEPAVLQHAAASPGRLVFPVAKPRPVFVRRTADLGDIAPTTYKTRARNALIVDLTTGETLYEHRPDRAIPPASMTKIMTAYVAFEAIASGEIDADRVVRISPRAATRRGSSMRLKAGETARVIDLIEGVVVASGNDAATALAEALSGSEALFARRMTERGEAIGLAASRFKNASGLPAQGHVMSLRDLAILTVRLERDFPEQMPMFGQRRMQWRGVRLRNRNPALRLDLRDLGAVADGLKTGHTNAAGYCVVATATQTIREPNGAPPTTRRVAVVLAGLPTEAARAKETERALRWALAQR